MNEQARIQARADALDELRKAGLACRPHPMLIDCIIVAARDGDCTISARDVSRFIAGETAA